MDSVPIHIIALSTAGFEKCKARFEQAGFKNPIHHLNAVDGKSVRDQYVNDRSKLSLRALTEIEHADTREAHSSMPSWGGVGCYLSHVQLWEKCKSDDKQLFVAEEDAAPVPNAVAEIKKQLEQAKKVAGDDLMYWPGYIGGKNLVRVPNTDLKRPTKSVVYGTQMYLVTPKCATKLLQDAFPMEVQVDSYLKYLVLNNSVNILLSKVPLVRQDNPTGTKIQTKMIEASNTGNTAAMNTQNVTIIVALVGVIVFVLFFSLLSKLFNPRSQKISSGVIER